MAETLTQGAAAAVGINPMAPAHLPSFLPGPDGSDPMMTSVLVGLILLLVAAGSFYLHLHSLPERMAHGRNSKIMELVAVLCLLALFTHNNFFWFAALILVFLPMPDLLTPLVSMSRSLRRLAAQESAVQAAGATASAPIHGDESTAHKDAHESDLPVDMVATAATERREAAHEAHVKTEMPAAQGAKEPGRDGNA